MTNITPTDPEFQDQDEWRRERAVAPENQYVTTNYVTLSEWQAEGRQERYLQKLQIPPVEKLIEMLNNTSETTTEDYKDALVAQRSEQDAHNVLVTGSSPVEGTINIIETPEIICENILNNTFNTPIDLDNPDGIALNNISNPAWEMSGKATMDWKPFLSFEEKCAIYEEALLKIKSITKVDTPADRSAESFFFVAAGMRQQAIKALKKAGVI